MNYIARKKYKDVCCNTIFGEGYLKRPFDLRKNGQINEIIRFLVVLSNFFKVKGVIYQ